MVRLVLINGAPSSGKSTLGRLYSEEPPLGRLDFVLELEAVAGEVGAQFVEIALVSDPDDAVARFTRRAAEPENDEHRAATALQERSGGTKGLVEMHSRLMKVVEARPATRLVVTVEGEIAATYRSLLQQIDR